MYVYARSVVPIRINGNYCVASLVIGSMLPKSKSTMDWDWIGLWNLGFKPAPGQQRPFSTLTKRISLREWITRTKRANKKRDSSRTTRLVAAGGRREAAKTLR